MKKLIHKTISELNQLSKKASSARLAKINKIKKAISQKKPDPVLQLLYKSGALKDLASYWSKQSAKSPGKIQEGLRDKKRPVYKILIDMHVLNTISGDAKSIFEELNACKQTDIARYFGVSRNAVCKLVTAGDHKISYTPGGSIHFDKTVKSLDESGFGKKSENLKFKSDATEETTEEEIQKYLDGAPITLNTPRVIIERYKTIQAAEKDRIKNEKELKVLVNFNETAEKVFDFLRPLRDDIQDIAKRVSPIVYQAGSKHEAEQVITAEINRILLSRVGEGYNFDEDLKKKIIQVLKR